MGKTVSSQTEQQILQVIETVNNMERPTTAPRRRVVRGSGGGSSLVYIEITATTNISTYTGTIFDNPIDRNSVEVGVTIRSLKQSDGTIPNSAAGQGEWCIFVNDVYHVVNPSIAYGT